MTGLWPAHTSGPALPQRITGSSLDWGRDLALIGAVTGFAAPASVLGVGAGPFLLTSSMVGLVAGLLLGAEMPRFLDSARRRLPLVSIGVRCSAAGAAVGAFIGLIAAQATGQVFVEPFVVAGIAGGVQFGWVWLPYTVLTVLERPTWPVVVAACALAPILGPLSIAAAHAVLGLIL